MDQVRLTRRMKRLAAESFMIVASILVAFALDEWWDARQRTAQGQDLMRALLSEFEAGDAELERVQRRHEEVVAACDLILGALRSSRSDAEVALESSVLAMLLNTSTANPQRGTLDALFASGELDLLGSQQVRTLLADWPAVLADYQEDEEAARLFVLERLIPGLGPFVDLRPVYDTRLLETVLRGESQSGAARSPDASTAVLVPPSQEVISLIETRRYFALFALAQLQSVMEEHWNLRAQLSAAVE